MFRELLGGLWGALSRKGMAVQSVLCSKKKFSTAADAAAWCNEHDFHAGKVDETEDTYRFRQFDPGECQEGSFRTTSLTDGVQAVVCRLRDEKGLRGRFTVNFPLEVKRDDRGILLEGYASRELWDQVNDCVPAETAFKALETYFAHGAKVCVMHCWRLDGGKIESLEVVDDGIRVKVRPRASIAPLIEDGTLNGFSIGYRLHTFETVPEGRKFQHWSLYEISLVDVPANQGCYFDAEGKMLPKGTRVIYDATRKTMTVTGLNHDAMGQLAGLLSGMIGKLPEPLNQEKGFNAVESLVFKRTTEQGSEISDTQWESIVRSLEAGKSLEDALASAAPSEGESDSNEGAKEMADENKGGVIPAGPATSPTHPIAAEGKTEPAKESPVTLDAVKAALEGERKVLADQMKAIEARFELLEKTVTDLMQLMADMPRPATSMPVNGLGSKADKKDNKSVFAGIFGDAS